MQILSLWLKKTDGCKNNSEKLSTIKVGEHIPCGYSMFAIWTFEGIENKDGLYRGEDCKKKSCEYLREHKMKVINSEKKKTIPLTNEEYKSYPNKTNCHICKKKSKIKVLMKKILYSCRLLLYRLVQGCCT